MMLVKTRVGPSSIHGMGLFAVDAIPAGTPVWRFVSGFDQEISPERFAALPEQAQAHIRWFAYQDMATGAWMLSGDHTCFMNHADRPNTGASAEATPPVTTTVALRDIVAGEELTCDYRAFDAESGVKLGGDI